MQVIDPMLRRQGKYAPKPQASRALGRAIANARSVGRTTEFHRFVDMVLGRFPWRRAIPEPVLDRDYLHIVDHHLEHLIPILNTSIDPASVHNVVDFGC